ncbi:MAG: PTS sugar transporter subunit IIA [Alphaproteobacteria bacterium]
MDLSTLIPVTAIVPDLKVTSKKQALQELAAIGAQHCPLPAADIFEVLLERERLGSTGVGQGTAIPHGRFANLDGLTACFFRLPHAIDFEAIDDKPVDLIVLLMAPDGAGADHLKALAKISRLLRDKPLCDKIRGCESADAIHALITEHDVAS